MAELGLESIATKADSRSKRPVKRRALTPVSEQATQIESLFKDPTKEIRLPTASKTRTADSLGPPPEIVANVQGSSAGAGSGEFHVYKASRRREYERMRLMEDEVKREKADEEFESKREEARRKDEERTEKNRKKREKRKATGKSKKGSAGNNDDDQDDGDMEIDNESNKKKKKIPRLGPLPPRKHDDQSSVMDNNPESHPGYEEPGVIIHDDD